MLVDTPPPPALPTTRHTPYAHVHDYLAFVRWANATTAAGHPIQIHWAGPTLDAAAWRREFRHALDARINHKGRTTIRSRYAPPDLASGYNFSGFVRDRDRLNDIRTKRIRIYQFETRCVRDRFRHLLASRDDAY